MGGSARQYRGGDELWDAAAVEAAFASAAHKVSLDLVSSG